jgi:phenylacetate-CoA ligase
MPWEIQSAVRGIEWPALPGRGAADVLALVHQLEDSQWLAPGRLRVLQEEQLQVLLEHAYRSTDFYPVHWGAAPDVRRFGELPLVERRELQAGFERFRSRAVPEAHGRGQETGTSGSTGTPVRVLRTPLDQLFWSAFTLRDHLWHRRDLKAKLAVIRFGAVNARAGSWGAATAGVVETGPLVTLGVDAGLEAQIDWLERERPAYLLTYPTLAGALALRCLERGLRLAGLREVRTFSEVFEPGLRELCREAWDAKVTDLYSAVEAGYLALQCPEGEHYHVQAEGVLLEVLDDAGRPCAPGEVGRVVLTDLHSFATPLIRYDIGDFAEPAPACGCGRGLPALARIVGRRRNMLVTASGERYWPSFGGLGALRIAPVRQYQCVQKSYSLIELRLVTSALLAPSQEEHLRVHFLSRLPAGFDARITYCDGIERGAGGKFEDFISEVA